MNGNGNGHWVKLYSKLFDSAIWQDCPDSWLKVWLGVLLHATYKPTTSRNGDIPPGCCRETLGTYADMFRVSVPTVRRAFRFLETQGMISVLATNHFTKVMVVNWDTYQEHCSSSRQTNGKPAANQRQTKGVLKSVGSIRIEGENNSCSPLNAANEFALTPSEPKPKKPKSVDPLESPEFNAWYGLYPRHTGRGKAAVVYAKRAALVGHEVLLSALQAQLPGLLAKQPQFRPLPTTWLNEGRYLDEPEQDPWADI